MMRRLIALLLLVSAPHSWAALRLVSKAGTNSGTCVGSPCLTIQFAASQVVAGDTLRIGAGVYVETVTFSQALSSSGVDTIIEGDSAAPTESGQTYGSTVIVDCNGAARCMSFTGPVRRLRFRNITIRGGTTALLSFSGGSSLTTIQNTLSDFRLDDNPGTLVGWDASKGSYPGASALELLTMRQSEIFDFEIEGDPAGTTNGGDSHAALAGVPEGSGANATGFAGNNDDGAGTGNWIHHFTISNFAGGLALAGSAWTIWEHGWVRAIRGLVDQGTAESYNDNAVIWRFMKMTDMCPDAVPYSTILNIRSTHAGNGRRSSIIAYNNTVEIPSTCPDSASGGGTFWRRHSFQDETFAPNSDFVSINNIFLGRWSTSSAFGMHVVENTPDDITDCPISGKGFRLDHNLFDITQGNRYSVRQAIYEDPDCSWLVAAGQPPTNANGDDYEGDGDVVGSALLDGNFDPTSSSPACSAGSESYTAWDGGKSARWIGAAEGDCAGGGTPPPPPPGPTGVILFGMKIP